MNALRRRLARAAREPPEEERAAREDTSPDGGDDGDDGPPAKHRRRQPKLHARPTWGVGAKRRHAWVFALGGIFGLLLAAFLANTNDLIDLPGLNLEGIVDVLPAGFMSDIYEFQTHEKEAVSYDSFAVGMAARSQGITATHPVIMIPGVISTGLESWSVDEVSKSYFRKRLWGSWSMMRALVMDKAEWKRMLMLDTETGLDPPGVKLRAAQGFDASDFFITGYWIWNKILENLATIGYDPQNAFTAAYDWRLSYMDFERRDQYFTRLKSHIELAVRISNKKAVLLSHSMGSQVLYYFLHWVEAEGHGDGGPGWVDAYIDSWINISGCMLGALKGIPALLSGEMRDTAQLNAFAVYGLERFLGRADRAELLRAMPGISSMLPMGGEAVWGNSTWAPDDRPDQDASYGSFISFRDVSSNGNASQPQYLANLTVAAALPFLFEETEPWYRKMVEKSYSHGIAHTRAQVEKNQKDPRKWVNPLETRLPLAPNLKIFCFYGVGKPTERAYLYRAEQDATSRVNVTIDTGFSTDDGRIVNGVLIGDGDGTVNLLSAGYMCSKGWKMKRYNPSGAKITVHEMPHEPDRFSARGGPNTGEHVDILGRASLNDLILRVAGGKGELIEENILSRIREYSDRVKIEDDVA